MTKQSTRRQHLIGGLTGAFTGGLWGWVAVIIFGMSPALAIASTIPIIVAILYFGPKVERFIQKKNKKA